MQKVNAKGKLVYINIKKDERIFNIQDSPN